MRFHSDTITWQDIDHAASLAEVSIETQELHGSRKRKQAFEISLRGNSKRRPNFYNGDGQYAATWDQWGVFIGYLYSIDYNLTTWADKDAEAFYYRTGGRFDLDWEAPVNAAFNEVVPFPLSHDHTFRYAGTPRSQTCTKCGATQNWS